MKNIVHVPRVFDAEYGLMEIIWGNNNKIRMKDLVAKGYETREWKRTTVYTMVKRLGDRGVLIYTDGIVTALYTRHEVALARVIELANMCYGSDLNALISDAAMLSEDKENSIGSSQGELPGTYANRKHAVKAIEEVIKVGILKDDLKSNLKDIAHRIEYDDWD